MRQLLKRSCVYSRLFVCLALSVTCLYSIAQATNQHDNTVTLSGTNISLGDIFHAIKLQTGISVMYSKAVTGLDQGDQVTVRFSKTPLDQVLAILFKGKDLEWSYNDNVVLIRKRENPPAIPVKKSVGDSSINSISVTGRVTDASGLPLPGATVQVKGEVQGTVTDVDGKFTLPKVGGRDLLVISSVGYETREIPVRGKTILAQLNVVVNELDETVVVAYNTTTRRLKTGNITTIKSSEIEKQPTGNPLLALQGRVPGLFITQANGLPGTAVTVRIQGQNSINMGNDPLYVIDGVPYNAQMLPGIGNILGAGGALNGMGTSGNPFNYINPLDIESIDILKDADATAIYGSRAGNGAILITTKKGKAGKTRIDVDLQQGWGEVARKVEMMDTRQYLAMRHEALKNDGNLVPSPVDYDINGTWDTTRYTNWQKSLLGNTSKYSNYSASVSGGSETTQFLVGANFHRETSVFPGHFTDQKGSVHFNINSLSLNQKFRFQLSGNYLIDNNQLPQTDLTFTALQLAPNAPALYNPDGTLNWAPNASGNTTWTGGQHPLSALLNTYSNKVNNLISSAMVGYQLLPGLELKSTFGYTYQQSDEMILNPLVTWAKEYQPFIPRFASYGNNNANSWIIEPQVNYSHSIGKGKLDVLAGMTIQQNNSKGIQLYGVGFNSDQVMEDIHAASATGVNSTIKAVYKYNAGFGRINYNWQDKYLIDLTARRDGSSRFGSANQFHNFGAVGLGWIFSKENFVKSNLRLVSFGKIRASYGTTGNDQIGDYQFLSLYDPITPGNPYQGAGGIIVNRLSNPYLQWEETKKLQFGLDVGFFRDRLLLDINYVHNRSSNQLLPYKLPIISGFGGITRNFPAVVQNTAWEILLNANILKGKFNWNSSINLTIPKNKLIAFPTLENSGYSSRLVIGEPLSVAKVFHSTGVDPQTGIYTFLDSHGNSTSSPDYLTDRNVLVNLSPRFYGGFQNSLSYEGFELNFLFQFVKQQAGNFLYGSAVPGGNNLNQPVYVVDRWQKPGDLSHAQRANSNYSLFQSYNFVTSSDAAISDATYIRLKNISISWQLPAKWKSVTRLQNCRLLLRGQNLFTFTGYKGLDPETPGTSALPPLRILTVGIQATL